MLDVKAVLWLYTAKKIITVTKNLQNSSNNTMAMLAISLIGMDYTTKYIVYLLKSEVILIHFFLAVEPTLSCRLFPIHFSL